MNDDGIIVAGDDGVILGDGDRTRCEHCGEWFAFAGTATTFGGSTWRYRCPHCQRFTEGPPPE